MGFTSSFKPHHDHDFISGDPLIDRNARRTSWVLALTSAMMVVEIAAGYVTGSMALLADGWHMASHAGAMALTVLAYRLARLPSLQGHFSFGAGKILPLGGYTSAIVLAIIAILMAVESVRRFFLPHPIAFNEAIAVAIIGLVVNLVSAWILNVRGHLEGPTHEELGHEPHDHNVRSAYLHVLADGLTSLFAIVALTAGKYLGTPWLDPFMGVVGSAVILRWSYGLCKDSAWELLDGHSRRIMRDEIRDLIIAEGAQVLDLHLWRVAPKAVACELVVASERPRGADFYRSRILERFTLEHLIVEERLKA